MSTHNQDSPRASLVEQRSIDYIPESERHGRLFSQFTLWFGANLQVRPLLRALWQSCWAGMCFGR